MKDSDNENISKRPAEPIIISEVLDMAQRISDDWFDKVIEKLTPLAVVKG